jgi:hypothetical protein
LNLQCVLRSLANRAAVAATAPFCGRVVPAFPGDRFG